jgi:hypothetical protein
VQKSFLNKLLKIILQKRKAWIGLTMPCTRSTGLVHGAPVFIKPKPLASRWTARIRRVKGYTQDQIWALDI